jgi:hypothetical protein
MTLPIDQSSSSSPALTSPNGGYELMTCCLRMERASKGQDVSVVADQRERQRTRGRGKTSRVAHLVRGGVPEAHAEGQHALGRKSRLPSFGTFDPIRNEK